MKRLLVLTENHERGGGNRYLIDLVNGVLDDASVLIVSNRNGIYAEDKVRLKKGCLFLEVSFASAEKFVRAAGQSRGVLILAKAAARVSVPFLFLYNVMYFIRLLRQERPDVLLGCNGGYPASRAVLAGLVSARLLGIPAALSIVSMPMRRRKPDWVWEWFLDNLVRRSARIVIVNAEAIAKELFSVRGIEGDKVRIVYNGLESTDAHPRTIPMEIRPIVIGCVARLDRMKGHSFLLDAFQKLAARLPQVRLSIVGSGEMLDVLKQRAISRGLDQRIEFHGFFSGNVNELLKSFDIYVFPSLLEGFPYSILEAMRAGCPIVATNVGGIGEAIRDQKEGLLVSAASASELETALDRLCSEPALRERLGKAARSRFEERFSLEVMSGAVKNLFQTELI